MYEQDLIEYRQRKDEFFGRHPQSPLLPEQQAQFHGLNYFPPNTDLRLTLDLDTDVPHDVIVMETTTGAEQHYQRAGRVRFEVDGQELTLALFEAEPGGDLFLPFRDATSGHESYGAGRYIELPAADADGAVQLDFNLAYNPYCAYNERWSCPIPPVENWLAAPIRAGEMTFEEHAAEAE